MKLLILALTLTITMAFGQGSSTGLSQMKLPASARLAAMGESLVAEPGDLGSISTNPANLYRNDNLVILLTHNEWIQDLRSEQIAFGHPFSFGTVGLTISSTSITDIEIRERPGPALTTFTARSASLQLSVATPLLQDIVIGTSARFLYEKLYVDEATGLAVDIGLLYHPPVHGLVAGFSLTNIGGTSALAIEPVPLPRKAALGASYRLNLGDFTLIAASQLVREDRTGVQRLSAGLEAVFHEDLALRLGYQTGYDARALSAGLGVQYRVLTFDYAFIPFSYNLGTAHLFTIGFTI